MVFMIPFSVEVEFKIPLNFECANIFVYSIMLAWLYLTKSWQNSCSLFQGFEVNCQGYLNRGQNYSYTYMVDVDGPAPRDKSDPTNVEPFPVECQMQVEPPLGITIVHHEQESQVIILSQTTSVEIFSIVSGHEILVQTPKFLSKFLQHFVSKISMPSLFY